MREYCILQLWIASYTCDFQTNAYLHLLWVVLVWELSLSSSSSSLQYVLDRTCQSELQLDRKHYPVSINWLLNG